jgi:hypothetical protein
MRPLIYNRRKYYVKFSCYRQMFNLVEPPPVVIVGRQVGMEADEGHTRLERSVIDHTALLTIVHLFLIHLVIGL